MKAILFIISLLISISAFSQCYMGNLAEGTESFEQGKYSEAQQYYQTALKCPDAGSGTMARDFMTKCDAKAKATSMKTSQATWDIELVFVQGDSFIMGSNIGDQD